ncbi:hypothetical protein KL907_003302 [Ogataea polymorpha]|nr:hypothetical protein KL907_003302 [Ogataea polymorpha]
MICVLQKCGYIPDFWLYVHKIRTPVTAQLDIFLKMSRQSPKVRFLGPHAEKIVELLSGVATLLHRMRNSPLHRLKPVGIRGILFFEARAHELHTLVYGQSCRKLYRQQLNSSTAQHAYKAFKSLKAPIG